MRIPLDTDGKTVVPQTQPQGLYIPGYGPEDRQTAFAPEDFKNQKNVFITLARHPILHIGLGRPIFTIGEDERSYNLDAFSAIGRALSSYSFEEGKTYQELLEGIKYCPCFCYYRDWIEITTKNKREQKMHLEHFLNDALRCLTLVGFSLYGARAPRFAALDSNPLDERFEYQLKKRPKWEEIKILHALEKEGFDLAASVRPFYDQFATEAALFCPNQEDRLPLYIHG